MQKLSGGFTLIELMIVVAIIGILAALALPLYQDHVVRSQAARIMDETGSLKSAVEICMNEGRANVGAADADCKSTATGSSLMVGEAQDATELPPGTGVPKITIDTGTKTATIVATIGASAAGILDTEKLTWTRGVNGSWTCATTMPERYRPSGCR